MYRWLDILYSGISGYLISLTFCFILDNKRFYRILAILHTCIATAVYSFWIYNKTMIALLPSPQIRQTLRSFSIFLLYILFVSLFKVKLKKKILAYGTIMLTAFLAEAVMTFLYAVVWKVSLEEGQNMPLPQRLSCFITNILLYAFALLLAFTICKRTKIKYNSKTVFAIIALLFCFCFMTTIVSTTYFNQNSVYTTLTIVALYLITGCAMTILIYIFKSLNEKEVLQEKLKYMQEMQHLEFKYYLNLQEKAKEIKSIRHDINDQIQTVKTLLKSRQPREFDLAVEIIEALDQRVKKASAPLFSENAAINAILAAKAEQAEIQGVQLEAHINLPSDIPGMEIYDLNLLFVNLLNNAISACAAAKTPVPKRFVIKSSIVNADNLIIKMKNPFSSLRVSESGKLKTTKADEENHGLGLMIIENISQKYNGTVLLERDNLEFEAIVTIPLKHEPCQDVR